jgi:hypothetical protein
VIADSSIGRFIAAMNAPIGNPQSHNESAICGQQSAMVARQDATL